MRDPDQLGAVADPVAQCHLDLPGLRRQRQRYRRLGRQVTATAWRPCALEIHFGPDLDTELLEEALAVERECCPFFRLDFDSDRYQLLISVEPEQKPALEAIHYAISGQDEHDLDAPGRV